MYDIIYITLFIYNNRCYSKWGWTNNLLLTKISHMFTCRVPSVYIMQIAEHPVTILGTVFCVICSLLMFLVDVNGDHIVKAYSSKGIIMGLYGSINHIGVAQSGQLFLCIAT